MAILVIATIIDPDYDQIISIDNDSYYDLIISINNGAEYFTFTVFGFLLKRRDNNTTFIKT